MQDFPGNNYPENDHGFPFDKSGKNPFSSPEGYFDAFSSKVFAKIEAEEELKEFSILSSIPKQQPFAVPAHYFENSLEWQEEMAAYPAIAGIAKPILVPVEENYFEASAQQILYKAGLADELQAYQTLYALDKQHGFTVAPDYFDNLGANVRDRIIATGNRPVSVLGRIMDVIFRPQFAVSFSALLLVAFSVFIYNRPETPAPAGAKDCKTLACLEKSDLLDDNTVHTFDDDNLYDMVDVKAFGTQISKEMGRPDTTVQEQYIIDNMSTDQLIDEL